MEYLWKNDSPDSCTDVLFRSFGEAAVQTPISGFTQLANRLLNPLTGTEETLPELRLIEPALRYEQGTTAWYAQQTGYGFGYAADLALLGRITRGRVPPGITPIPRAGTAALARSSGTQATLYNFGLGATAEGVFRPIHEDEMEQFWTARFRNATVGGVTFSTLMASRGATNTLLTSKSTLLSASRPLASLTRLTAGAASTIPASVAAAEVHSLMSNGDLATWDEFSRTATPNLVCGLLLTKRGFLLPPAEKTGLNLKRETENFRNLAERIGIADSAKNMETFETRARNAGLSRQEIARTYHNLSKLGDPNRLGVLSADYKKELATQSLFQAANPTVIDQGQNNTCNITTSEGWLYATAPSDPIRMLWKIAQRGRFETHRGVVVSFTDTQIQPDDEAKILYPAIHGSGSRSYASQLFQFGAINSHWQNQTRTPDGRTVPKGSLRYDKLPVEGNPSLKQECLVDTSVNPPQRLSLPEGLINSPTLRLSDILSTERQITGRYSTSRMLWNTKTSLDSIDSVTKPEELAPKLKELKAHGKFPITVVVYITQEPLANGDITCNRLSGISGCHVLQITDYDDANDRVYVDGSWGNARDFSGKPGQQPALSREQLYQIMQDGTARTKHLNLAGQKDFKDEALYVVSRLSILESADLLDTNISNQGVAHFKGLQSVKSLTLSGTKVDDGCRDTLATLANLETLNLANTQIGDQTLDAISGLTKLKLVDVSQTNVTEKGVVRLAEKGVSKITVQAGLLCRERIDELQNKYKCGISIAPLVMDRAKFGDDDLMKTNNLHNFEELDLFLTQVTSKGIEHLKGCTNLRQLFVNYTKVDDSCLDTIATLTSLKSLEVAGTLVTDKILDKAANLEKLEHLNLLSTKVTAEGLAKFTPPKALKTLAVDADIVTPEFLQRMMDAEISVNMTLRDNRTLFVQTPRTVDCWKPSAFVPVLHSPEDLKCMDKFSGSLEELQLSFFGQDNLGFQFEKFQKLKWLGITGYKFDNSAATNFHQLKNLDTLNLSTPEFDGKCIDELRQCSKLSTLTIAGSSFNADGIARINKLTQLQSLSLVWAPLADDVAVKLNLPQLKSFSLSTTGISDRSVNGIMANMPDLEELYLDGNPAITDASIPALLALKSLKSISVLGTGISKEGLKQLSSKPGMKIINGGDPSVLKFIRPIHLGTVGSAMLDPRAVPVAPPAPVR